MDKLYDIVMDIHRKYGIESNIKEDDLLEYIEQLEDKDIERKISDFYKMVPYRLLTPLFSRELTGLPDYKKNGVIADLSCSDENSFYRINTESKTVIINDQWIEYIQKNQAVVYGWMNYKLIEFLQRRNPNVPAIPLKLRAPKKRNLGEARKIWRLMSETTAIYDLYTEKELNAQNCDKYGCLSIDHFIPWSFVMHDELWNLAPTFASINSSKNDRLPSLDQYLKRFCDIQYETYSFIRANDALRKHMEGYISLSRKIDFSENIDNRLFSDSIRSAVRPLFQIAYNQGYEMWSF